MSALGLDTNLLPGAPRLLQAHAAELPQKDELCGAFWATIAMRSAGVEVIDQDEIAAAAGTVLSRAAADVLPAGETGRRDFRLDLPVIDDPSRSGTGIPGLIDAVREVSHATLDALPVMGEWTPARVAGLLDIVADLDRATVVANVGTRFFWGSRPSPGQIAAYLESGDLAGPAPDWEVGHFVGFVGRVHGRRGTLVVVADTYRSLGHDGVHLQPIEAVATALARPGMTSGGVLLVLPAGDAPGVAGRVSDLGLTISSWDNGTEELPGDECRSR